MWRYTHIQNSFDNRIFSAAAFKAHLLTYLHVDAGLSQLQLQLQLMTVKYYTAEGWPVELIDIT